MSPHLRIIAALLFVLLMALLLGPAPALEAQRPGLDKVGHFGVFGLLLWCLGVLFTRVRRMALAIAALLIGIATEVIQGMTGRDAEMLDVLADGLGIMVALIVWAAWRGFAPRRHFRR